MIVALGGNGHLGQWTVAALTARGYDVVNVSRTPRITPSIEGVTWVRPVRALACDLTDFESVMAVKDELCSADAIVHLAAHIPESTSRNSDEDADATLSNVTGTIHLLNALTDSKSIRSFVYASTFEVYGTPEYLPVDEKHPTEPLSYYGASKLAGEKYVTLFGTEKHIATSILRFPAIYGPGDMLNRAIGNFVRAAMEGKPITIYGEGEDLRDMVYVADAAQAIVRSLEFQADGIFNIGNGQGTSIRMLAEVAQATSQKKIEITYLPRQKTRLDYVLDTKHAQVTLDWQSTTSLKEGISAQLAWLERQN